MRARSDDASDAALSEFFAPARSRELDFANSQDFDRDGLIGRARSSSYVPAPGHALHDAFFWSSIESTKRTRSTVECDSSTRRGSIWDASDDPAGATSAPSQYFKLVASFLPMWRDAREMDQKL
jgi:hypothetical protein